MRVLVGGSHRLIGSRLVQRLTEEGDEAVRLVRSVDAEIESDVRWDPVTGPVDIRDMELFDAVIHLGGIGIGERRWSQAERSRIWNSRVLSTDALVKAFGQLINPPKTFICASAVGYYGDQGDNEITEDTPAGEGFLASLCQQWEKSAAAATDQGLRVANLRSGVVLSDQGGSLLRQIPLFKLGLGGRMGTGNQWMSWIDLDDEVSAIIHILRNDSISGPLNLTSPEPLTNYDYTQLLAAVLRRPAWVPAPRWMISLALGYAFTDEVLLVSQRAVPQRLLESGFEFAHPDAAESLVRLLAPERMEELREIQGSQFDLGPRPIVLPDAPPEDGTHTDKQNGS